MEIHFFFLFLIFFEICKCNNQATDPPVLQKYFQIASLKKGFPDPNDQTNANPGTNYKMKYCMNDDATCTRLWIINQNSAVSYYEGYLHKHFTHDELKDLKIYEKHSGSETSEKLILHLVKCDKININDKFYLLEINERIIELVRLKIFPKDRLNIQIITIRMELTRVGENQYEANQRNFDLDLGDAFEKIYYQNSLKNPPKLFKTVPNILGCMDTAVCFQKIVDIFDFKIEDKKLSPNHNIFNHVISKVLLKNESYDLFLWIKNLNYTFASHTPPSSTNPKSAATPDDFDFCSSSTKFCKNGGKCLAETTNNLHLIKCVCPYNFKGIVCEHPAYHPTFKFKKNTQKAQAGDQCIKGYLGNFCEKKTCEKIKMCKNEGICTVNKNIRSCKCPKDKIGDVCEITLTPELADKLKNASEDYTYILVIIWMLGGFIITTITLKKFGIL